MNRADRTTKVLLALLVIGVWGLLLRPLLTAAPAQAQQQPAPAQEQEIVGSRGVCPNPTAVVIKDAIYVIGDGYITRYDTSSGQSLRQTNSDKLPSRSIFKAPGPGQFGPGR
jgi:hypothetical protein